MIDWRRSLLALVAEIAYRWAWDIGAAPDGPGALRATTDEVRRIDLNLCRLAAELAQELERRDELLETFHIDTEWLGPGPNLWALIEAASNEYPAWSMTANTQMRRFLCVALGQSRAGPGLSNVLRALGNSEPQIPIALNASAQQVVAKRQGAGADSWPLRVRMLMADLDDQEWEDRSGQTVTFLDCFNPGMLSTLGCVAAGFDPFEPGLPSLDVEAMAKALRRYRVRGPR